MFGILRQEPSRKKVTRAPQARFTDMHSDTAPDSFRTLLDGPSPATLTTYRQDGSAVGSPVWFRVHGDAVEVVIAESDVKLRHLARRPDCALLIFEAEPPFRGIRLEGEPTLTRGDVSSARLAIASKYLGAQQGRQFTQGRGPGVVLSLPLSRARMWDLSGILP